MAKTTIEDPDIYRKCVPVDDRGRVVIGRQLAGKKVNIVVEVEDA